MHIHPFRDLLGSLQWGNTDHQTWEKGKTRTRETKTGTKQYQKGLGQDSGTYPRLFALLPPSTGGKSIWQIPTFSRSQCPGALSCTTFYIQSCLSSYRAEELSIQLCFNLLYPQRRSFSSATWQESLSHSAVGFQSLEVADRHHGGFCLPVEQRMRRGPLYSLSAR